MKIQHQVGIHGGDEVHLELDLDAQGKVLKSFWKVTGSLELLEKCHQLKKLWVGESKQWSVPEGTSPSDLLLRELALRARGEWPADEEVDVELCHCRNVPQKVVERAIILGADTVEKVRARTMANTGCGTCRPEVERLLKLYLK